MSDAPTATATDDWQSGDGRKIVGDSEHCLARGLAWPEVTSERQLRGKVFNYTLLTERIESLSCLKFVRSLAHSLRCSLDHLRSLLWAALHEQRNFRNLVINKLEMGLSIFQQLLLEVFDCEMCFQVALLVLVLSLWVIRSLIASSSFNNNFNSKTLTIMVDSNYHQWSIRTELCSRIL